MWKLFSLFLAFLPSVFVDAGFPAARCLVHPCAASPYDLVWTRHSPGQICFTISAKTCFDTSKYNCCNKFNDQLYKIVLTSRPECDAKKVSINGVNKGGGIYFTRAIDNLTAELRLTALLFDANSAIGKEICIQPIGSTCQGVEAFCGPKCRFSVFDPFSHDCCPTCLMSSFVVLPPRPPLPPFHSPVPKLPIRPMIPLPPFAPQSPYEPYLPIWPVNKSPPPPPSCKKWCQYCCIVD